MAQAIVGFSALLINTDIQHLKSQTTKWVHRPSHGMAQVQCCQRASFGAPGNHDWLKIASSKPKKNEWRIYSFEDMSLYSLAIENLPTIYEKSEWHLDENSIKAIYTLYTSFTIWGCCVFGSMKDPFYDGDPYRKDGGDGSQNWWYEKAEEDEAAAREELWREELIEEIEQKVGGLRELEEAEKKEKELV